MRFNSKGKFNVPFCRKPERFRPAYITRIVNQVARLEEIMKGKDWKFQTQSWEKTLELAGPEDFVYLDPPYLGRNTGYYNTEWKEETALDLAKRVKALSCPSALSMWKENKYRKNTHLKEHWSWPGTVEKEIEHFYHVGSSESLRNAVAEVLILIP